MIGPPDVRIIAAPYDSGHRGLRMGVGPEHLVERGLAGTLRSDGRIPSLVDVRPTGEPAAEVATAFELDGLVSAEVGGAISAGEFPLVLSGNCNTSVGTISGSSPEGLGVVWFDAHADFNTPETTTTGFTDGMGLAIAVGHCWKALAGGVPGFSPVAESSVVLAGIRAVEPLEEERLGASNVAVVGAEGIRRAGLGHLETALDGLKTRVRRVYVHLDLDVLDPDAVGRANEFAPEGGLGVGELETALGMIRTRFTVAAAGIASYDPAFDVEDRVLGAAFGCARLLASPPAGVV